MPATTSPAEHAPHNAMDGADEVARFYDRCSDLMRELLDELAGAPDTPRPFSEIEDALGWPRRRIASVLGGVARVRQMEFAGRRPYRFLDTRQSASGRWELWSDAAQARGLRVARQAEAEEGGSAEREAGVRTSRASGDRRPRAARPSGSRSPRLRP